MLKIAVIAAMQKEAALFEKICEKDIVIAHSGIGKVAAALKTFEIIQKFHPDLVINSGVAGGLNSELAIGEMVCGKTVCYHDVWCGAPNKIGQVQNFPLFFESDAQALQCLTSTIKKGLIISGDQFICDRYELEKLKQNFPEALAVDMESAAIAQTCYMSRVPFLSLRLISDTPGVQYHQDQYDSFWRNAPEVSFKNVTQVIDCMRTMFANLSVD